VEKLEKNDKENGAKLRGMTKLFSLIPQHFDGIQDKKGGVNLANLVHRLTGKGRKRVLEKGERLLSFKGG